LLAKFAIEFPLGEGIGIDNNNDDVGKSDTPEFFHCADGASVNGSLQKATCAGTGATRDRNCSIWGEPQTGNRAFEIVNLPFTVRSSRRDADDQPILQRYTLHFPRGHIDLSNAKKDKDGGLEGVQFIYGLPSGRPAAYVLSTSIPKPPDDPGADDSFGTVYLRLHVWWTSVQHRQVHA
jgi:hypothetical protein